MQRTHDLNVREMVQLTAPKDLKEELPMDEVANRTVVEGREAIRRILAREDDRLLAIVGPCSIHDPGAAREYAGRLRELAKELADRLFILMRVYFEKPRTTLGWKGLVYDPRLDGSEELPTGLRWARQLLLEINRMGLPAGTEMLDPITPQYLADLITWASIGARTTESQTHREMASGLSMPVGFKNSTAGNLQVAINALESARHPHSFLGIDQEGHTCMVRTSGNPWGHLVMRGGSGQPNYYPESIEEASEKLTQAGIEPIVLIDCSHANSGKKFERQERVVQSVVQQKVMGDNVIMGMMIESSLNEGNQKIPEDLSQLRYGVSVTDECLGWEATERLLRFAHGELKGRLAVAV
ncbi:MAG: 3-deoxy-7-phosphoheptulonate synthase [Gemmatimonadetes bacterium]|nr:3-deoxy-7-phosphoheptulonate synthase [Gemmatimonadota bacterium]